MKVVLRLPPGLFEELIEHLLPPGSLREEAAFLCVSKTQHADMTTFDVQATEKLAPADFHEHAGNYLELADDTRARLIKRAHDLNASLVEFHSHPDPRYAAGFSIADYHGLLETVPHMWWRLQRRPYLAFVVAPGGFDALVWLDNPTKPQPLDALVAGDKLLRPTNHSLRLWS